MRLLLGKGDEKHPFIRGEGGHRVTLTRQSHPQTVMAGKDVVITIINLI